MNPRRTTFRCSMALPPRTGASYVFDFLLTLIRRRCTSFSQCWYNRLFTARISTDPRTVDSFRMSILSTTKIFSRVQVFRFLLNLMLKDFTSAESRYGHRLQSPDPRSHWRRDLEHRPRKTNILLFVPQVDLHCHSVSNDAFAVERSIGAPRPFCTPFDVYSLPSSRTLQRLRPADPYILWLFF